MSGFFFFLATLCGFQDFTSLTRDQTMVLVMTVLTES